jgi:hypothetical protein
MHDNVADPSLSVNTDKKPLFCGSRSRSTSADRALAESAQSSRQRTEVGHGEESRTALHACGRDRGRKRRRACEGRHCVRIALSRENGRGTVLKSIWATVPLGWLTYQ